MKRLSNALAFAAYTWAWMHIAAAILGAAVGLGVILALLKLKELGI